MDFRGLDSVGAEDIWLVGGKAAALGELLRAGLPIPPGFVVTVHAFVGHQRQPSAAFRANLLQAFDDLGSLRVAVRSSAVNEDGQKASWAGQLNTFLHVARADLLARIRDCWASAGSERATQYARQHNLEPGAIAVIVQRMVPSTVSGVAFSVHPVTQNRDHLIIEAGLGLGEAIVSGQITPDTYVVRKSSQAILECHIAKQQKQLQGDAWLPVDPDAAIRQKLSDKHIRALARQVQAIETHFGYPVDVEWALASGTLYITQARPITTLLKGHNRRAA